MITEHSGWMHPWLRVERSTRTIIADRLTRGASDKADVVLAQIINERKRIERAGWFN